MTDDLRRLRLDGLIERIPHTNTYVTTEESIRFAVIYSKLDKRLPRPLFEANTPPTPADLRQALRTIDHAVDEYVTNERLGAAS